MLTQSLCLRKQMHVIIILEDNSATKINKHTACDYSLITHCSFYTIKNKHDCYKGKNCMKNFSEDLKNRATEQN